VLGFRKKELAKMFKLSVCLLTILALALPSQAALLKNDETKIIISGKGVVKAEPDVAYVTVGVERTEKTATEAQRIAAQKMNNIQGSLKKMGIKDNKIETTRVSLQPSYQYEKGKRTLVGYTARNQIKVTIDKLDDVGKIIDNSISAGATNVYNISFSIKDESLPKQVALKKAFENARDKAKAEVIASAAGLTLKKIKSIQESGARIIRPVSGVRAMQANEMAAAPETPITPGKVEIRGSLTVVYECTQK
jgi:uncharacterized protein YggE